MFLVLASVATGQASHQPFGLWAGASDFASRGALGVRQGETLQGVHASHIRGLFELDRRSVVTAFRCVVQDARGASPESFDLVIRRGSDASGPTPGAAGIIGTARGLRTPPGRGVAAYMVTAVLTTPIPLPDSRSHFSFGIALPAAPAWPADGLSTHISSFLMQHSNLRQEDHAWQIVGSATAATHPTMLRTWRYEIFSHVGAMRLGCGGRFGMGGMFPRVSSPSVPLPLDAFFRGGTACAGGMPIVGIALFRTDGVSYGQTGRLYLGGPILVLRGAPTNANGSGLVPIAPHLPISMHAAGQLHVQGAIVLRNGAMKLTNAMSMTL